MANYLRLQSTSQSTSSIVVRSALLPRNNEVVGNVLIFSDTIIFQINRKRLHYWVLKGLKCSNLKLKLYLNKLNESS